MRSATILVLAGGCALVACGSNTPAKPRDAAVDAPKPRDAMVDVHFGTQTVFPVDCATITPDATVFAEDGVNTSYFPSGTTNILVGQVVQFTMSVTHNVAGGPGPSDVGLRVDFMEKACLKFTVAGPFNFQCTTHAFYGVVNVN